MGRQPANTSDVIQNDLLINSGMKFRTLKTILFTNLSNAPEDIKISCGSRNFCAFKLTVPGKTVYRLDKAQALTAASVEKKYRNGSLKLLTPQGKVIHVDTSVQNDTTVNDMIARCTCLNYVQPDLPVEKIKYQSAPEEITPIEI